MNIARINGDIKTAPQGYTIISAFSDDLSCVVGIPKVMNEMFNVDRRRDAIKYYKSGNLGKLDNLYLLFVKETSYDAPNWDRFVAAFKDFKNKCIKNKIKKIAMPKICCGKNGFNDVAVLDIIMDEFENTDIDIIIYDLEK